MRAWIGEHLQSAAALTARVAGDAAWQARAGALCQAVIECLDGGGKILTIGNGGSAADALHLAEELLGRYSADRRPWPAVCLAADGSLLTCIINDYGYDEVFARQVRGLARPGDAVIAFSTSGRSENILAGLRAAREAGVRTLGLLGKGGGPAAELCDVALVVPSDDTARIQEIHGLTLHLICEAIDRWTAGLPR